MTTAQAGHLSEEAMNDVLIGMGSVEATAHLTACSHCRVQVEQFHVDLKLLDETSLAWSKSKSVHKLRVLPQWNVRQAILAPLGWTMAAVVVLVVAIPGYLHERSAQPGPMAVAGSEYGDSDAQIAQDNALLSSVDIALSGEDATLKQLGIPEKATDRFTGLRKAAFRP